MESQLVSNEIYVTYISGVSSKGQDILKTQKFSKIGIDVDEKNMSEIVQAIGNVMEKSIIDMGIIQKYALEF